MTLAELTHRLREGGIPDAETDARLLLCHFESVSPALLFAEPSRDYQSDALEAAVRRRLTREPLQHIIGTVCFFEECYEVSSKCLVPRSDTELLVEQAIRRLPKGARFADLGTGSGCIAISVLAHRKDLTALAVDISEDALSIARRNAERNGVSDRVSFVCADMLNAPATLLAGVSAILSNPPYIRAEALATLSPELAFEPRTALDGGEDGLLFYREILARFPAPLYLFEIGFDQREGILRLAEQNGLCGEVLCDLGGRDRLAVLKADA